MTHYTEKELNTLWEELTDITTTPMGMTTMDFIHFPQGTDKIDIWKWFDENSYKPVYHRLYPEEQPNEPSEAL